MKEMESKKGSLMQPSPSLVPILPALPLPSQIQDVLSSPPYLQTYQVAFSFRFHIVQTPTEETTTTASPLSAKPGQPHLAGGARGKLREAEAAEPTQLLVGKGMQSFGELKHPHCTWSFQENSLGEGAQQLFQACADCLQACKSLTSRQIFSRMA